MPWSHGHVAMVWICVAAVGLLGAACGADDGAAVAEFERVRSCDFGLHGHGGERQGDQRGGGGRAVPGLGGRAELRARQANAAIDDVGTTPSGAVSDDQWPAIQATVVPALVEVEATGRDWAKALLSAEWPPPVASHVEDLALAVTESASVYGEIADAEDFDTFFELYNSADTTATFEASTAAATTVREDLGLDSETDPPDWCALAAPS